MAFSLIGRRGGLDASVWHWIVAYNMIAFGSQSLLGLATDRWRAPRLVAALGCGFTAAGVMACGVSPVKPPVFGPGLMRVSKSRSKQRVSSVTPTAK